MSDKRQRILAGLKFVLALVIERKLDEVPIFFRPMLAKVDLTPETVVASLEETITEDDWLELEAMFP